MNELGNQLKIKNEELRMNVLAKLHKTNQANPLIQ
jgi:hypothetical protein